jgi:hypothetical protein
MRLGRDMPSAMGLFTQGKFFGKIELLDIHPPSINHRIRTFQ